MSNHNQPIPVFVVNLKKREDRRKHIVNEFSGYGEYCVRLVEAIESERGTRGLWETIKKVIRSQAGTNEDFIFICEDDHQFTADYSWDFLGDCIREAMKLDADILLGGISSAKRALPITGALWWVDDFSGFQFTVLFRKFFQVILDAQFEENDAVDHKIASITENKFFVYPFISTQRDFGYSDVTPQNNEEGRVDALFAQTAESILQLSRVNSFYSTPPSPIPEYLVESLNKIALPVYVINLPERRDRLEHILSQFSGRKEFEVTIVEASKHKRGAAGLWASIRRIIQMAEPTEEDLIIICEDDHTFTEHYDSEQFIRNIIEAYFQGTDILVGGACGGFIHAIPVSEKRFWISHFYCTQFIVIYRSLFKRILDEPFDDELLTADGLLSDITSNKQVLFPFISVQRDFGYSDVTSSNNLVKGRVEQMFETGRERLEAIQKAAMKRVRSDYLPPTDTDLTKL